MTTYRRFSYADYEAAIRAPHYDQLHEIAAATALNFVECSRVLDVASGQGFLLDALSAQNIEATGVDNEPRLVNECRARGLTVIESDVIEYLTTTSDRFDGAYCGHLIEHLPYDVLLNLVEGIHRILNAGGTFIVRWPNPRSGQTVFNSYWKDPTHVRFYDGAFIETLLKFYGFDIIETHYDTVMPRVTGKSSSELPIMDAGRSLSNYQPHSVRRKPGWQVGELFRLAFMGPLRVNELFNQLNRQQLKIDDLQHKIDDLEARSQFPISIFELPAEAYVIARRVPEVIE